MRKTILFLATLTLSACGYLFEGRPGFFNSSLEADTLTVFSGGPYGAVQDKPLELVPTIIRRGKTDFRERTFLWDFGDGASSSNPRPSHTYAAAGSYTATLTVRDGDGLLASSTTNVTVTKTLLSLVADAGADLTPNEGAELAFSGNASGGMGAYTFSWDFGDGTAGTGQTPTHTYGDNGTFETTLTVSDSNGSRAIDKVSIVVSNMVPLATMPATLTLQAGVDHIFNVQVTDPGVSDGPFTYSWNFGDGATSTLASPLHFFTAVQDYTVRVTVTDKDGGVSLAAIQTVSVTPPPPLSVSLASQSSFPEGSLVSFMPVISGGIRPYTYAWNFGDGGTSTEGPSVSHSYSDNGNYSLNLTVSDSEGSSKTTSQNLVVSNANPTVAAPSSLSGVVNSYVVFFASVDDPSPIDAAQGFAYNWSFGDGSTSNQASPSHAYNAAGNYTVQISVIDKDGGVSNVASTTVSVTVSPPGPGPLAPGNFIITPFARIPNFGLYPTRTAVASGNWNDPKVWDSGVPQAGDIVAIPNPYTVTYNVQSDVLIKTITIRQGGKVEFRPDISTRLRVTNLQILEGGTLEIGTASNPIASSQKAELIFSDVPNDTVNDPEQFGNGLIALGKVTMHGAIVSNSFVRLGAEPKSGDTTLTLSTPVTGWKASDQLILPDSRQLDTDELGGIGYSQHWETVSISSISSDGRQITLSNPLQFDHPGARDMDGNLAFLPHVGNATRNIVVRSANPTGTRGYVFVTHRAEFDARYVQFLSLGRSRQPAPDNTTYGSDGLPNHVGTNQNYRDPITFFHVFGPVTTPASGHQYTLLGSSIACFVENHNVKWGIALPDSHFGLIKDNLVYNWRGAGIAGTQSTESKNTIDGNLIVRIMGDTNQATAEVRADRNNASEGVGIWFHGFDNFVRNNVVANVGSNAYTYFAAADAPGVGYRGNVRVPLAQGSDPTITNQYKTVQVKATPFLENRGNESYGHMAAGESIWSLGVDGSGDPLLVRDLTGAPMPIPPSTMSNNVYWHVSHCAVSLFPVYKLNVDGITVRGDSTSGIKNDSCGIASNGNFAADISVTNANIQGVEMGYEAANRTLANGFQIIQDSFLRNYTNIQILGPAQAPVGLGLTPITFSIKNVRYGLPASMPGQPTPSADINAMWNVNSNSKMFVPMAILVEQFNGVSGDNFQVFFREQRANYPLPGGVTDVDAIGAAGMTNAQVWSQFGKAAAGAVGPDDVPANWRNRINGTVR